jgi:pyruvate formate lyase activating enzyme
VLERLRAQGLGDRAVMELKGPMPLYAALTGAPVDAQDVERSMTLASGFPEFRFATTVAPVPVAEDGPATPRYLTPEEIAATALWLKQATGSHRQPYFLRVFDPLSSADERFRRMERLAPVALVRHRTAARRHQVLTEVEPLPA